MSNDDEIPCPHCGHVHELSDPDVSSSVVSYWGEEPHDFTCFLCGEDFVVGEQVTRKFTTAKTIEELDED
jgi:predicted RNA-binding Zn-ribbon protein involved in translation (DUF1610 family)